MSANKILLKFAKKGINLSPEAYNKVINAENPTDFASSLIVKLKSDKFTSKDLVSVSKETIDELLGDSTKIQKENQYNLTEEKPPVKDKKVLTEKPKTPTGEDKPITEVKKENPSMEDFKKESDVKEKHVNEFILEASETVKDEKIQFKRNLEKT